MVVRRILLPTPLKHQRDILLDAHRFKVGDCGRRFGKTLFGLIACVDGHGPRVDGVPKFRGAVHGATIWWVAPSFPISKKIWRDLKRALRKWGIEIEKDEQEKRIDFPGGGSITVKSAHDPDSLRGDGIDGLVIDEAAFCPEDAWNLSLRPTLADRQGWAILISTPKGMNWFYQEWLLGSEHRDPDYASWKRPSSDNPTLAPEELDRMRRKMGLYAFQRECLAEFDVREGGMFRREWFQYYRREGAHLVPDQGTFAFEEQLSVFITADLALSAQNYSDFTVVIVWGRAPDGRLFVLDVTRGKYEAPVIVPMLRRTLERWGARTIWLEASGPLTRLNREAIEAGLPVREYKIHTDKGRNDKVSRATPCAAAVEQGRVLLLKGAPWVVDLLSECCAFPDPSVHDDQVDALALGVLVKPAPRGPGSTEGQQPRRPRDEDDERESGWLIGR